MSKYAFSDRISKAELFDEYERVIAEERKLGDYRDDGIMAPGRAAEIYDAAWRMLEIAKSSALPRSYAYRYGMSLTPVKMCYESVGGHTNLALALVDLAIRYWYGPNFGTPEGDFQETVDGYYLMEVMEAMRLHDLPENVIGDIPDDGNRDDEAKAADEAQYFNDYINHYPPNEIYFGGKVKRLLVEMNLKASTTGRLLYEADKVSALVMTLTYDYLGYAPVLSIDDPKASQRDIESMMVCDWSQSGCYKASEMWAVGHFKTRKICQYDDLGIFTALVVMLTLMINGHWYDWREKDYDSSTPLT